MKTINSNGLRKAIREVKTGKRVKIYDFVNLYECEIGDDTQVGAFTEIQKGVKIGKRCRIQSHVFICGMVTIHDDVFIGHGVMFINDKYPTAKKTRAKAYKTQPVLVKKGATIGTGAIIMAGVTIGEQAFVGAGAVVTKDVDDNTTVLGIPAKKVKA